MCVGAKRQYNVHIFDKIIFFYQAAVAIKICDLFSLAGLRYRCTLLLTLGVWL